MNRPVPKASIYDTPAVDRLRGELKFEPRRLRALRTEYFKKFRGASAGWVELGADYFFNPYGNSSGYIGAGLSLGNHSIPDEGGDYQNAGLQAKGTFGYEMFRASTIRLTMHFDATLPMFRLSRENIDPVTLTEVTEHVYSPTFQLSLMLGWGGRSN